MELVLNLVWLVVAAAGLILAGWQLSGTGGTKRFRKWHSLIALCCVLVILFFVISMTDDLHEQQIASEESHSLRLLPKDASQDSGAKHSYHSDSHRAVRISSALEPIALICLGCLNPLSLTDSSIHRTTSLSGRAPPFLSF